MNQLKCEMCGSTDLLKQDGVFVCQSCGCKYSVEEARKMMVEGTVEVTGTVRVDESVKKHEQISNYLEMAKTAFDGLDSEGVVSYCNRILEIDPDNCEAWIMRAKSAGWGSTLKNVKISQAISAAKRAVNLAPDSKKYEVAADIYFTIKSQIMQLLTIARNMPLSDSGYLHTHKMMLEWQSALQEIPYLSKDLMESEISKCESIVKDAILGTSIFSNDLIKLAHLRCNNGVDYYKTFRKTLSEKIKHEEEKEQALEAKARAEADEKRAAYWKAHADEKSALDEKKSVAESRKTALTAEMEQIPELLQVKNMQTQIDELSKQIGALGIFKGKEKKALQMQIDDIEKELAPIKRILQEKQQKIQAEIKKQTSIIAEVDAELCKDR